MDLQPSLSAWPTLGSDASSWSTLHEEWKNQDVTRQLLREFTSSPLVAAVISKETDSEMNKSSRSLWDPTSGTSWALSNERPSTLALHALRIHCRTVLAVVPGVLRGVFWFRRLLHSPEFFPIFAGVGGSAHHEDVTFVFPHGAFSIERWKRPLALGWRRGSDGQGSALHLRRLLTWRVDGRKATTNAGAGDRCLFKFFFLLENLSSVSIHVLLPALLSSQGGTWGDGQAQRAYVRSIAGTALEDTPWIIPVRGHLDNVMRLTGDINIGWGSRGTWG